MDTNDSLRKCDYCKETKPKSLFIKYKLCKKCEIKNFITESLKIALCAKKLNLSTLEIKDILKVKNGPDNNHNSIGEHRRYDEVICIYLENNYKIDEIVENFNN